MPELRLNLVTREWVIIATERAKRPMDFKNSVDKPAVPPYLKTCPFCPGNEYRTPQEHYRLPFDGNWKIRVVDNKYPALSPGEKKRVSDGYKRSISGIGVHEVIVENPIHNISTALMDVRDIEDIFRVYKARFIDAHKDPTVEHVILFKNHGESAGTTLEHTHSQLVGTPVVPIQIRDRVQAALHYFDDTGECMICSILKREKEEGARVIIDTGHFLTFVPYAALSPFHTWIFPKRHSAVFSDITEEEIRDIAYHLKVLLSKFHYGLEDPDYNYVIRSSRPQDRGNEYCHWYLSIVPRLTKTAGFELGSGMFINTVVPEKSAEFLKGVRPG
ncbi:MAG: galactose-1-phosphate uridylyltransferase [Deltaproteobacteria bacterium]|nr:galactose-1-phosphate uridylyltransferase [Deltaproteobacteria bacterium]